MLERILQRRAAATTGRRAAVRIPWWVSVPAIMAFTCYALWDTFSAPFDYPPVRFSSQLNEKRLSSVFGRDSKGVVRVLKTVSRPGSATGDFRRAYYMLECEAATFSGAPGLEGQELIPMRAPVAGTPTNPDRSDSEDNAILDLFEPWVRLAEPLSRVFAGADLAKATLGVIMKERDVTLVVDQSSSPTLVVYLAVGVPLHEEGVR